MEFFPILFSSRLKLRKLDPDDFPALVRHANNRKISDQIINIPHPYQELDAVMRMSYIVQGFKAKSRYVFAVVRKEEDELIGEISLHLEQDKSIAQLGYWIAEPFWNQGYATEAIAAVLSFGFEKLDLQLVYATSRADNGASCRILEKNGMKAHSLTGNVVQFRLSAEDRGVVGK